MLALSLALLSPLNAVACAGGGSAVASGGGVPNPIGSFGAQPSTYAAAFGVLFLLVAGQLAIPLLVFMRRRRQAGMPVAQLSPDARFWWDGATWHDSALAAPPRLVRSADGAYEWDGDVWRPLATS